MDREISERIREVKAKEGDICVSVSIGCYWVGCGVVVTYGAACMLACMDVCTDVWMNKRINEWV